jgi:hypothetical protein
VTCVLWAVERREMSLDSASAPVRRSVMSWVKDARKLVCTCSQRGSVGWCVREFWGGLRADQKGMM